MAASSSDIFIYLKTGYKSLQPIKILVSPGQTIDVEEVVTKARGEKKAETAEAKAAKAAAKATAKATAKAKAKAKTAEVPVAEDEMTYRQKIVHLMKQNEDEMKEHNKKSQGRDRSQATSKGRRPIRATPRRCSTRATVCELQEEGFSLPHSQEPRPGFER